MRKLLIPVAALVLVLIGGTTRAHAGGSTGSVGVGFEQMILGPGGASLVYDGGKFHAGAFFGFGNNDFSLDPGNVKTDVDFGAQAFFHIHSTAMSDFGVGGSLGYRAVNFYDDNNPNTDDSASYLYFDLGAQIRVFVVSNVALSGTLGLSIGTADADGVAVGGDPVADFGVHYYFF
jgi:hypothetical protein